MAKAGKVAKRNAGKPNICFDCAKACGRCSWSEIDPKTNKVRFEPVPGWTAEKVRLNIGNWGEQPTIRETYHITACPEFEKEENRNQVDGFAVSDEQFEAMLARWRRLGEI